MASLPTENDAVPPVWDATTSFQYSFEDNESSTLWNTYTNVSTSSTGGAADGDKYGVFASDALARKFINNSAGFWIRFCVDFGSTRNADRDVFDLDYDPTYSGTYTTLIKLEYLQATDQLKCHITNKVWSRSNTWQTIEYYVAVADQEVHVWVDGTKVGSGSIGDVSDQALRVTWCDETADTTIHIDAIRIDTFRVGLPGNVAATSGAYVREADVSLDGVAFNILDNQYQEQDISGFAPRFGTGAPAYSDLSGFQHFLIPSFHKGIGQPEMIGSGQGDENMYMLGLDVDTTGYSCVRLANGYVDSDYVSDVDAYDAMPGGEVVSCDMDGKPVYGLRFGSAKASASYACLFWRDGNSLNSKAFTCTNGVQDVLYNGQYLFVTLGGSGVRMQKTTDLTNWTNVGNDSLPPTDMGKMAIYDEFLWVADRREPIVYRAGQTDASDLAKETVMGVGAHRVGPGWAPLRWA